MKICRRLPIGESHSVWSWGLTSNGSFSSASLREAIDDMNLRRAGPPTILNKIVPSKVRICNWRARLDILPIKSNLVKRGINIFDDICVLCNVTSERCEHVFLHCTKVNDVKRAINAWRKLLPETSCNMEDFFGLNGDQTNLERRINLITRQVFIWVVWKDRNEALFNN